jgi:hypothetical protein
VSRSRRRSVLLLLLLAVVVNLPLGHSTWTQSKVERSGVDVTATVTDHRVTGDDHWVSFRFPEDVDPDRRTWQAEVDETTYDAAVSSREIGVRVLDDDPAAYRADGAVESRGLLVATLVVDGVLVLIALLLWRFGGRMRGRMRAQLRAVALEDVERGPGEVLLERIHSEDYLIRGEVLELSDGQVVLDLGNRTIVVLLDGHHNPVGSQEPAQVRARMIG